MSAPIPTWHCTVTRGRVVLERARDFACYARTLEGERAEVILRKRRVRRSDQANRYYWGVVVALIAEFTGYEPEEAHDALKALFLTDHTVDGPLPHIRSTASLNTAEFADYIERVRRWAATDLGVSIPDANEVAA